MAEKSWDDEDFDPGVNYSSRVTDKWEGEDEDDAADNWEDLDEDEQKAAEEKKKLETVKKKKSLKDKIAEKEEKLKKEREERIKAKEQMEKELTAEERQKRVEESDFELAKNMLGVNDAKPVGDGIESMQPKSKSDFEEFANALSKKICQFETNPFYATFLESLFRNLTVNIESDSIKKLGTCLTVLATEKSKQEKPAKGKKKKTGPKLKQDNNTDYYDDEYGDFNDFM
ncbi:DgyrCDS448 [Dimorphilus gyrociliatus]|uniref:Eukaryotic translation initiation factor 3 subunit J n=1 Tax=Dimorphilus gyrociliatus TaxID=2664684 RepID=A0A7I8V657_9ANNE|nr:DgyrCDS448 [Dimorphilus gyrociliatus]